MAVPVPFADIGKSVSDLLTKDYPVGIVKIEVNSQTVNGVKFTATGSQTSEGQVAAEVKAKFFDAANRITFTESYDRASNLTLKTEVADALTAGLKVDVEGTYKTDSGARFGKLKFGYKREHVNVNTSVAISADNKPTVGADLVVGYEGVVGGADVSYAVADAKVNSFQFAIGYLQPDYSASIKAKNVASASGFATSYSASYYHQVEPALAVGVEASVARAASPTFKLGAQYVIDKEASIKTFVDTEGKVGTAYSHKLRNGVKAIVGGVYNTAAKEGTAPLKLGLSLVIDA